MSFLKRKPTPVLVTPVESNEPLPLPKGDNQRELPSPGEVRKVKLGIIVGHTGSEPGAKSIEGFTEYEYNSEIAELAAAYAGRFQVIQVIVIKRDGVGIAGAYAIAAKNGCDAVIELHFNDFNGVAFGSETLCSSDLTDMEFAHEVHAKVCEAFGRSGMSRGVKVLSRSSRGAENVHSFPHGVNCLVEPFFGDHPDEAVLATHNKRAYAEAIIQGVILWAKKNDFI
jgi:N-acetylmuramoyl-L-alanine amidase